MDKLIKEKLTDKGRWYFSALASLFVLLNFVHLSCNEPAKIKNSQADKQNIICTNESCIGAYVGPEFINRSDVAHQYSNKMSAAVGNKLKELYDHKLYSKVDFENIEMTTKGMGSGEVTYYLQIPFIRVKGKCDAYTSFDHVGGWNHAPALSERKRQLANALLKDDELNISNLKTTKEGLQEYWIQWRNKEKQSGCTDKK